MAFERQRAVAALDAQWQAQPRWRTLRRPYSADQVIALRGSISIEYTLARRGAERLWAALQTEPFVAALGAVTGNQAMQQVKAGLKAVYLSGWQVASDANLAGEMYPDHALYPADSMPALVKRVNQTLLRCDQIQWSEGKNPDDADFIDYCVPIIADAEAGFGGVLNAFELMKALVTAGAAAVHFEDQLPSSKKCGHVGGKVLVPTRDAIAKLIAARLAADVLDVPTLLIARTDAAAADLLTSDIDENDRPFCTGELTVEGFYRTRAGLGQAVSRALAYAPYADLLWCETPAPDLAYARQFAEAVRRVFPLKPLAYNCSPSFNWRKQLDEHQIANFQRELGAMGYKFQFITLAGFHSLNHAMFELAQGFQREHMTAFARLQDSEVAATDLGFTGMMHQREVGTGYFDQVTQTIEGARSSTMALPGSIETAQFIDD